MKAAGPLKQTRTENSLCSHESPDFKQTEDKGDDTDPVELRASTLSDVKTSQKERAGAATNCWKLSVQTRFPFLWRNPSTWLMAEHERRHTENSLEPETQSVTCQPWTAFKQLIESGSSTVSINPVCIQSRCLKAARWCLEMSRQLPLSIFTAPPSSGHHQIPSADSRDVFSSAATIPASLPKSV